MNHTLQDITYKGFNIGHDDCAVYLGSQSYRDCSSGDRAFTTNAGQLKTLPVRNIDASAKQTVEVSILANHTLVSSSYKRTLSHTGKGLFGSKAGVYKDRRTVVKIVFHDDQ